MQSKQSKLCRLGNHAVPQRSVIGGLIFIIFSNDFPASSKEGESVMYVDTEVVHDDDPEALKSKIQHEADRSEGWLQDKPERRANYL